MKNNNISFRVFNEESVLIHWNDKINIKLIDSIISYKNLIEKELKNVLIECVQSINSMMVIYNSNKINLVLLKKIGKADHKNFYKITDIQKFTKNQFSNTSIE